MTDRTAAWIRALWPPLMAAVAIITLLAGFAARLEAAENINVDHEARIRNVEEACARGMATQELILEELRWMRDHWPTAVE